MWPASSVPGPRCETSKPFVQQDHEHLSLCRAQLRCETIDLLNQVGRQLDVHEARANGHALLQITKPQPGTGRRAGRALHGPWTTPARGGAQPSLGLSSSHSPATPAPKRRRCPRRRWHRQSRRPRCVRDTARCSLECSGESRMVYCRTRRLMINMPEPPSRRAVTARLPADKAGAETPAVMQAQIRSSTDCVAVAVVVGDAHQEAKSLLSVSI